MPTNTTGDKQVSDAIVGADAMTLGSAVSSSMGMTNASHANSIGILMHSAVSSYQNAQISANAAITMSCARLIETSGTGTDAQTSRLLRALAGQHSSDDLIKNATQLAGHAVSLLNEEDPGFRTNKIAIEEMLAMIKSSGTAASQMEPAKDKKATRKTGTRRKVNRKKSG